MAASEGAKGAEKKEKQGRIVRRTYIGGQAVIEGVMMKGRASLATAVRTESGEITVEAKRIKDASARNVLLRLPFVRGVINLVTQLFMGVGVLMRSAEVFGDYAEPTKFDKWVAEKFRLNPMHILTTVSLVLGLALAVGLFVFLPNFLTGLIFEIPGTNDHPALLSLCEAAIMLVIFIGYLLSITLMKDIRRVFMYHGAEHKVISCYEHGLDLTVENARGMRTEHSRCGTTFIFFVVAVSIIVFALVNWMLQEIGWTRFDSVVNALVRLAVKLLFLPVVAGISYEILKLLARSDCLLFRVLRAPGMLMQKLTTKQPTDDMLEVSLTAFKTVLAMDADPDIPERKFEFNVPVKAARAKIKELAPDCDESDVDWVLAEVTGMKRSALAAAKSVTKEQFEAARAVALKMKDGAPLQYALGNTDFCGVRLSVCPSVLIPRPETEELAVMAAEELKKRGGGRVLDLCTGSGAIAVIAAGVEGTEVTATDISSAAADIARANALNAGVNVRVLVGDMFAPVKGEKFDLITVNPPYIPHADIAGLDKRVREFEPLSALDGGEDGLDFYRILASEAPSHLNAGGVLYAEFGIGQAEAVKELFSAFDVEIYKDMQGVDRMLRAAVKEEIGA